MKTVNILIYAVILIISGCSSQAVKTDKPLPISHYFKTQQNVKIEPIKRDIDILNFERVTFHARKIGYKNAISQILGAKSIGVAFSGALDKYVDKQTTVNLSLIDVTLREALSNFGSLSLLSEPHLRVINAQPAILSVGKSISFIKKIELSTTTVTGGTSTTTPTVDISSIFDGLVFGITPFIKNNDTVLLRIVPIKSKLVSLDEKTISGNTYTLPTVDLREESTVVSVKNGSIVMLGGLISKTSKNSSSGIPLLSNIPIAGLAFKQKEKLSNSVELVILLKPVIIN